MQATLHRRISAGEQKGSARGALICAVFAAPWMIWAVVFSGDSSPLWFTTVAVPVIALVVWAIKRVRSVRHLSYSAVDLEHARAFRKLFWIDTAIEWGLVAGAAYLLSHLGRFDLMPQVFGVIIGLHFLPLARVFRASRYYWTGGVMVAGAFCSLLISRGDVRNIAGCAVVGLTLWLTSANILARTSNVQNGRMALFII
jgi:hypothetical protein